MISEKICYTEPVVTLRQEGDLWSAALIYSDNTGSSDTKVSDRPTAEKVALVWAKKNKVPYVAPEQSFISVMQKSDQFIACEVLPDNNVVGKGKQLFSKFELAEKQAKKIAKEEQKPYAPRYYVSKGTTTLKVATSCNN